jgi:hypothetical protein
VAESVSLAISIAFYSSLVGSSTGTTGSLTSSIGCLISAASYFSFLRAVDSGGKWVYFLIKTSKFQTAS